MLPQPEQSTAETILHVLRPDSKYTPLEAKLLDTALILHMEHGGGNNSTFTTHLVSSSGTDTYSAIAAAIGSLKGPRHGGANIKVVKMFDDMKKHLHDWTDEAEVEAYLRALLNKEAFDHAGLIYGMGHAVYSLSDPRARIFRSFVEELSQEKGLSEEFALYTLVERLAPKKSLPKREKFTKVSVQMWISSQDSLTACWGSSVRALHSHFCDRPYCRMECSPFRRIILQWQKIMRPAYKNVCDHREFIPMDQQQDCFHDQTSYALMKTEREFPKSLLTFRIPSFLFLSFCFFFGFLSF